MYYFFDSNTTTSSNDTSTSVKCTWIAPLWEIWIGKEPTNLPYWNYNFERKSIDSPDSEIHIYKIWKNERHKLLISLVNLWGERVGKVKILKKHKERVRSTKGDNLLGNMWSSYFVNFCSRIYPAFFSHLIQMAPP